MTVRGLWDPIFMIPFTISATAHSPNYLPEYLADELGFFREEGLEIRRFAHDPWTGALDELVAGRADAVLGGAWLPALYHDYARKLSIFAQINGRYPLALLSRKPVDANDWSWLAGKTVLVPSSGGAAAYMLFTGLLREAGIDPGQMTILRDLSHEMYADLFIGGLGDAIVTYMVVAHRVMAQGHAVLATSLAKLSGPIPNSVYYTLPEVLQRGDAAKHFTRALQRAVDWLAVNGVRTSEVRQVLAKQWPEGNQDHLLEIAEEYHAVGLWSDGVRVSRAAMDRWQKLLVQGGLLKAPIAYADLVVSAPADFALTAASTDQNSGESYS
jgi:NitT/TauT family transport system substrate-binding protein